MSSQSETGAALARTLSTSVRNRLARAISGRRSEIESTWLASQFDPQLIARYGIAGATGPGRSSLQALFVAPLLALLIEYVRTGESRYRDVYLDERLRYAPFRASPATRAEFFGNVVPADERAVLATVDLADTDAAALRTLLTDLHTPLHTVPGGSTVRILALGDCLLNEVRVFISGACRCEGIAVDMRNLYFSAVVNRALDTNEAVEFVRQNPMDLIALSFLTYEGIPAYRALLHECDTLTMDELADRVHGLIDIMGGFLAALREHTDAPFLVHGASGLPLSRWRRRIPFVAPLSGGHRRILRCVNDAIGELVTRTPNAIFIDEPAIAAAAGLRECEQSVIPRRVVRKALFHTSRFGEVLSGAYARVVSAYARLHRTKVLLVDFDDTLWRGVMADGSVDHHRDRQRLLLQLKEAGILLVAVSKNDPANIRWDEMQLKPADFTLLKISWNMKVDAIRETAHELDLGLDSMVFIDDNPAERALVHDHLAAVRTLDAHDERTWDALAHMMRFPNTKETAEARTRTEMYRQQAARRALLAQSFDYGSMMHGLQLRATFRRAAMADLERVAELVQRTNQFNTTTIRYSKDELAALIADPAYRVYVSSLEDKFGRLGLVAVAVLARRGEDVVFEAFVMSCRAMGFQLERLVVRMALDAEPDAGRFLGHFAQTDRNTPARNLFADCGFRDDGTGAWVLEHGMPLPGLPTWIELSNRD